MRGGNSKTFSYEAIVSILFTILYLLIPTRMYYIDGIYYAEHLEHMPYFDQGFHPHHLIYLPLMHLLYGSFHIALPIVRAIIFMQVLNAILGGLTIWIFSWILRRFDFSLFSRISACMLLGVSYTFWHHATDANIYILANLLMLLVVSIVISDRFFQRGYAQILAGLLFGFACLIHQIVIPLIVPVGLYVWMRDKKSSIGILARFVIPFVSVLILAYSAVFYFFSDESSRSIGTFLTWVSSFGRAEHYFAFSPSYANDMIQTIVRGHYNAFFTLKPLEKILFDGSSGDTSESFRLYGYFLFLTLLTVIAFTFQTVFNRDEKSRKLFSFFLFQFAVYFILTSLFMPENHFYRLFYMCALIVIWTGMFSMLERSYRVVIKPLVAIAVISLFVMNLTKGIVPQSKAKYNPYLTMTAQLDSVMTDRDVILFPTKDRYFVGIYRYFGKGDAIHMQQGEHFLNLEELTPNLDQYKSETIDMLSERYDRIFLTRDAWDWLGVDSKDGIRVNPVVFTPKNYRLPHPDFMVVRVIDFEFVRWLEIYDEYYLMNRYYAEIRIRQQQDSDWN